MSSSYQTQYYSQQPNNNNLGLLTTGALAGGGLATLALLDRDKSIGTRIKLVQDINKKENLKETMAKGSEAISNLNEYSKKKAAEADILRKEMVTKLRKVGIDASTYSKEKLDQLIKQFATPSKGASAPVNTFTGQTTAAAGYPVGYSASAGVIQGDLAAMKQGLYKENLLLDPSKQYAVRPTGQQTQQVRKKPFRR